MWRRIIGLLISWRSVVLCVCTSAELQTAHEENALKLAVELLTVPFCSAIRSKEQGLYVKLYILQLLPLRHTFVTTSTGISVVTVALV